MKSSMQRTILLAGLAAMSLPAIAGEAEIRASLATIMRDQGKVVSIQKTSYGNLYEVVLSSKEIVYTDASGSFVIAGGQILDVKSKRNVTADRDRELNRINLAELPLNQAIKQVHGNGKRLLVTFEDPNCGYCKKLAKDLKELKDATIYTFMIPILKADSADKSRNIWCASDKAKAWNDWMIDGKVPEVALCDAPIAKNYEMARKYRISGTPTIFFADGYRSGGYMALADIDRAMNEAETASKSGTK